MKNDLLYLNEILPCSPNLGNGFAIFQIKNDGYTLDTKSWMHKVSC